MTARLRGPLYATLAAALAVVGWLLLNTSFLLHDDEGYVLLSLRSYSEHGRLYDLVFTQYGPVPFLYHDLIHRCLDLPITNTLGRALTLLHWVGAAAASGLIAWRLSSRYWAGLVAMALVFAHLRQNTWEPSHPGSFIAFVVATGLAVVLELLWRGRQRAAWLTFGAAGALLLLTKINLGIFWCAAGGACLLLQTEALATRRVGAWCASLGMAVLPFALMHNLLRDPRTLAFATVTAVIGVVVSVLIAVDATPRLTLRAWLAAAAGLVVTAVAAIGAVLARGTTWSGLLHGVLLDPLRHPVNFHFGFPWETGAWMVLAAGTALTTLWCFRPVLRARLADLIAALRILALVALLVETENWLHPYGVAQVMNALLVLVPLFVLPLTAPPAGDRRRFGSGLVALVAVLQVLHAFPVAGSQLAWGTFLLVPLFVSGLVDAAEHAARRLARPWVETALAALALAIAAGHGGLLAQRGWRQWVACEPLNLAGAEMIRPPESTRCALRILTANAQIHADVLFSRPGMYGFNLWSGVPTPTERNATHWFWLLSPEEQAAVVARLAGTPRSAVIHSPVLVDLLVRDLGMKMDGTLNTYIDQHYRRLFKVTAWDFLVPKNSPAAAFFVAQNFSQASGATGGERSLIEVKVAAQATISRIVLRDVRNPFRAIGEWHQGNARVTLTPINSAGRPAGPEQPAAWPVQINGLRHLRLFHDQPLPRDHADLELVFYDAAGRIVFEACYEDPVSASAPPAGG